ncbi:MAG: EAL domain-containing protein [Roseibium sp.]
MLSLSVILCLAGSAFSFHLLSKADRDGSDTRKIWLSWASLLAACTIWTGYLFAIAARKVYTQTGFDLEIALVALAFTLIGVFTSNTVSSYKNTYLSQLLGGILFGMTLAGTSAILLRSYNVASLENTVPTLDIWPVVLGIVFGTALVRLSTGLRTKVAYGSAVGLMPIAVLTIYLTSSGLPNPAVPTFFPPTSELLTNKQMLLVTLLILGACAGLAASGRVLHKHQKQSSQRAYRHLSLQDALTHLPNRQYVKQIAKSLLDQAKEDKKHCAVVLIGLDEFKTINDLHGYETGDAVLCTMANSLRHQFPENVVIAKFYGDEFLIVNPSMETPDDAIEFARQVRTLARQPVLLKKYRLSVRSSIGLAIYPRDGDNLDQLVQRANLASKQAKSIGGNLIQPYVTGMEENNRWEASLAADLRNATPENQLSLVFQRQNLTQSGKLIGLEALVRWRHTEKGPVPPEDFIPIAERSGIILDIGEWVLREACREAIKWSDPVTLSVNASPLQFSRSDFAGLVASVLMETGLPAERLEIELTESTPIEDHERVLDTIMALRKTGVRVAMDDFGTGYSSLNTLQAFPFDKIKVDRVFTRSLETNSHSRAILRSAILLGHSFGIPVIAEGVETRKQLEFLQETGCQEVQGFLFGKHLLPSQIATSQTNSKRSASQ